MKQTQFHTAVVFTACKAALRVSDVHNLSQVLQSMVQRFWGLILSSMELKT